MPLARSTFRAATQLSTRPSTARSLLLPRVLASTLQTRTTATATGSADDAHALLVAQRLRRPIAPHLSIYQPQLTWYMSAANRVSGVVLSGSVYLFGIAYAVAPLAGFHAESATIAAAVAALPLALKIALKASLATPFVFHCVNGLRHLTWDTAHELSIKGVYRTGYAVLGASALGAGYLTFFA